VTPRIEQTWSRHCARVLSKAPPRGPFEFLLIKSGDDAGCYTLSQVTNTIYELIAGYCAIGNHSYPTKIAQVSEDRWADLQLLAIAGLGEYWHVG